MTTTAAHGYSSNAWVEIAGVGPSGFNGLFQITVTGSNSFTYTAAGLANGSGSGTSMQARRSTRQISHSYDKAGRVLTLSDPDSFYTYSYDAAGRLSSTDNQYTANLPRAS